MTYEKARQFICEIVKKLEDNGIDHYTMMDIRKGNTKYYEITASIKITEED